MKNASKHPGGIMLSTAMQCRPPRRRWQHCLLRQALSRAIPSRRRARGGWEWMGSPIARNFSTSVNYPQSASISNSTGTITDIHPGDTSHSGRHSFGHSKLYTPHLARYTPHSKTCYTHVTLNCLCTLHSTLYTLILTLHTPHSRCYT